MVTVNPGVYFKELYPSYWRAAKICEVVYSNIDWLFMPKYNHAYGGSIASFVTLGGDEGIIRCRCLLGYYKQTGGDPIQDLKDFNQLLKDHKISPNNYTGGELSDAEHFFASAVITMVPVLGLALNPIANVFWDGTTVPGLTGLYKTYDKWDDYSLKQHYENFANRMRYDWAQLSGPDLAGHKYGMSVTYENNAKSYLSKLVSVFE